VSFCVGVVRVVVERRPGFFGGVQVLVIYDTLDTAILARFVIWSVPDVGDIVELGNNVV
jgi:hypothetical protein